MRKLLPVVVLFLASCSVFDEQDSGPSHYVDVSDIENPVPKDEPRSAGGNPSSYEVLGERYYVMASSKGFRQRGTASWYGNKFHGNKTSNGEVYDMYAMTAAHKSLPLPTYVRVTNLKNNRSVIVRVNDRGPFAKGRIIDLSYVAARKLDMVKTGTAPVEVVVLDGSTTTLADGLGQVMIQVIALRSQQKARDLAQSIANKLDVNVTISEINTANGQFYRIRLGPFRKQQDVDYWLAQLASMQYRDSKVIPIED